jgi:8-oxo-dGTP pyrophosphatase MutT (NUDIX family)
MAMNEADGIPGLARYLDRLRGKLRRADAAPPPLPGAERKAAAVLAPIFLRDGDLHVLYTRRSDRLASHRGQVAFPGGRFDRRDPHLLATALREAYEEVGIEPQAVEVLGWFEGQRTRSTDILVTPFVGFVRGNPRWRADPKEVAEIFDVPLKALGERRYRGHYRWSNDGRTTVHPAILYGGQTIWGLTYSLTLRLLEIAGPFDEPDAESSPPLRMASTK